MLTPEQMNELRAALGINSKKEAAGALKERINAIIAVQCAVEPSTIKPNSRILEDLCEDSLGASNWSWLLKKNSASPYRMRSPNRFARSETFTTLLLIGNKSDNTDEGHYAGRDQLVS